MSLSLCPFLFLCITALPPSFLLPSSLSPRLPPRHQVQIELPVGYIGVDVSGRQDLEVFNSKKHPAVDSTI